MLLEVQEGRLLPVAAAQNVHNDPLLPKNDDADQVCVFINKAANLNRLTAMATYMSPLFFELRDRLITFLVFVRWQRLIARNDRELFSSNRGVSHLNESCCIYALSKAFISGFKSY